MPLSNAWVHAQIGGLPKQGSNPFHGGTKLWWHVFEPFRGEFQATKNWLWYVKHMSHYNRHASASDLSQIWKSMWCQFSCPKTHLEECGLHAYRSKKKPLHKKMMQKRLSWAKQHVSWTKAQWDSVIFSDESKFNLHSSDHDGK